MKNQTRKTVPLGELILAVFDRAAQYSTNPQEVSRLATQAVSHMLWRAPRSKHVRLSLGAVS
jgi:hypothetical protein